MVQLPEHPRLQPPAEARAPPCCGTRGARSHVSAGHRSAAGHGDAQRLHADPTLPTLSSSTGRGQCTKKCLKRGSRPRRPPGGGGSGQGHARLKVSLKKLQKCKHGSIKAPLPPPPCKTPAVKSGSDSQRAHPWLPWGLEGPAWGPAPTSPARRASLALGRVGQALWQGRLRPHHQPWRG